jgi:competence/damage-inducible protein CinA-like protein
MKCEVVAIGDEVLLGHVANTNAAFLSHFLSEEGYEIAGHRVLPDKKEALKKGLQEAMERADFVIATGGLGPTLDDITREVAAELFHVKLLYNESVAAHLQKRYGKVDKNQATLPAKAYLFLNDVGTASGLLFDEGGKRVIFLPGVPQEMGPMFLEKVLPYLKEHFPPRRKKEHVHLDLLLISEDEVNPTLERLQREHPEIEFGIHPAYGSLRIRLAGKDLSKIKGELSERFASHLFSSPSGQIAEAVQHLMVAKKKRLAVAESCSGGKIATEITAISGSSDYFLGGIVAYSNLLKQKMLGVSEETLKAHGAVSREVVNEMLSGIFNRTDADFAMATSGIAGPLGGTLEKPVGTVWIGIAERGSPPLIQCHHFRGSRETIILKTARNALASLYRKIAYQL